MVRKVLLFDCFEAPEEFLNFIEELGYTYYHRNFELMFDERVIKFVEERLTKFRGRLVYKGKESYEFRIGFAGIMQIAEVDTSRPWCITVDNEDFFKVKYITMNTNEYGFTRICYDID